MSQLDIDPEAKTNGETASRTVENSSSKSNYWLNSCRWGLNGLAHTLIGFTVAMTMGYAVRNVVNMPLTTTRYHIIYCVLGYQLLMAEAILCFSSGNGWSHPLKLKHKRLLHWVMQLGGSALALFGSFHIIIFRSPNNFTTLHGIMGLVAMIFTSISLVNGLASLYAFELRGCLNANFTKAGHILFGTFAFIAASVCLCLGYDSNLFRDWASPEYTYILMGSTILLTIIIIVTPLINFGSRVRDMASK